MKGADMERLGIGIIGCGTISEAYLKAAADFPILDIKGLADIRHEAAEARASQFGLEAMPVEAMLADPAIQIIVNLTIPAAHVEVGMSALTAGKHVYSEKPLGLSTAEAGPLLDLAKEKGLRVGCAPDTFLGGSHQTCRKLIDDRAIGDPLGGSAFFMCPGHERWHANPAFYYATGGGPMLDMGPYYITALVNLIGPVARVSGAATRVRPERLITSEPLRGTKIPVEVATHVAGTLEFACGATVSIAMSFDVARHRHRPIELYGTEGSLSIPDPNRFFGAIELATATKDWTEQPTEHGFASGNHRGIGVADMAHAVRSGRPHRASGELAFHVLEVMEAFQLSSDQGAHVTIGSRPERPAMLAIPLQHDTLD
jgi:predicted dehydrogenase